MKRQNGKRGATKVQGYERAANYNRASSYASGNLASFTDLSGRTSSFEFDSRGDLVRLDLPDLELHAVTYDAHHMTEKRMPSGDRTTYAYNDTGRVYKETWQSGEKTTEVGYDANGWIARLQSIPSSAVQQISRVDGHRACGRRIVRGDAERRPPRSAIQ